MLRLGLPLALGGFFIDQATKWWVMDHVMNPPQVIPVTGFFNLVLGFNTGVSFGLFGQAPAWLLMAFTLAIVAGLLVWIHRSDSRLTASALGLVVGGALGNLLDRLRQGAVTDFLDFYIGSYHWPAFNLADVAIVCGVGLLLMEGIAKLLDVDCKSGDFSQSGRHLGGITVPQAEGIGSGMTVGDGGKSIAAGAEDDADLVVGSKEPLRLPRRFESSHDLFPSPRRPV